MGELHVCPKCKHVTASVGPHAAHWIVRDGKNVKVDCSGELLEEAKR